MSLISDALRKARQEAAEREARERGLESPMVAGYWRRRGHLASGLLLGAAIAVGAGVIGGSVVWWVLAEQTEEANAELPTADGPVLSDAGEEPPDRGGNQVMDSSQSIDASKAKMVEQRVAAADTAADSDAGTGGEDPGRNRGVGNDSGEPNVDKTDVAPAEEIHSTEPTLNNGSGNEFVAEATIGDVTLSLDYLLFRAENPFAQINGVDVRVGSVIENFVVEDITENSVVLVRNGTKVVLRVR